MKSIRDRFLATCVILVSLLGVLRWVQAQGDSSGNANLEEKWEQVGKNNEAILKSLSGLEDEINFVKARAMRGGRSS